MDGHAAQRDIQEVKKNESTTTSKRSTKEYFSPLLFCHRLLFPFLIPLFSFILLYFPTFLLSCVFLRLFLPLFT